MRATIPIALQPGTKVLRIERMPYNVSIRVEDTEYGDIHSIMQDSGYWILWLNTNHNFTLGTYLQLCDNGMINNVTINEDGTESIFMVKGED